jgi:alpha-glucosidase (family GH31 glycosyl hydrolase)
MKRSKIGEIRWLIGLVPVAFLLVFCAGCHDDSRDKIKFGNSMFSIEVDPVSTTYSIKDNKGVIIVPPHPESGLLVSISGGKEPIFPRLINPRIQENGFTADLQTDSGIVAVVTFFLENDYLHITMLAKNESEKLDMAIRTGPMGPIYGLGDHGGYEGKTELTGFGNEHFINDRTQHHNWNHYRFISTFAVFPAQGVAQVVFDRGEKQVVIDKSENRIGVIAGDRMNVYYFFGEPQKLYNTYRLVREKEGYSSKKPKYKFFELGYEAFGSLGWNTFQSSVQQDIDAYLDRDYPIKWAVVGSGFWKGERRTPQEGSTTSFGLWDSIAAPGRNDDLPNPRYPDPVGMKNFFMNRDIKLILGSRINFKGMPSDRGNYFPENDGDFSVVGLEKGYFLKEKNGAPKLFKVNFPLGNTYLLDTDNPEAVDWFVNRFSIWGANGIKEDLMLQDGVLLANDAKQNPVNEAFMDKGALVMVRNSAYGVPGDMLRLEDTRYGTDQDRPVINALNYAFSGVGNVYPDIVAGKYLKAPLTEDQKRYFVRNSILAAVMPVMSMGLGPWHLENPEYERTVKKAVDAHWQLVPYIYSEVVRGHETGYPFALTPLPLAFPLDENTYWLGDTTKRQYEWLIGESLLATPVYGNDYAKATSRDIYLPEGKWMDWESGSILEGGRFYPDYSFPDDKIPLFVGGKDCVVLRRGDDLFLYYFPLNFRSETFEFIFPDGVSRATVKTPTLKSNNYFVFEGNQEGEMIFDKEKHAFYFKIEPGRNYQIKEK